MKRFVLFCLTFLVAMGAMASSQAEPADQAKRLVSKFANAKSAELPKAHRGAGGHTLAPATLRGGQSTRTWLAVDGQGFGLTAELPKGSSSVTYPGVVPEDFTITLKDNGSAVVRDPEGRFASEIKSPWARDAVGRSLPTHYEVMGTSLVQHVNTDGATFPVIADPWVTHGWWYVTPVVYVELSWSETWAFKNGLAARGVDSLGIVCGVTGPFRPACVYLLKYVLPDVKKTVNAAIAAKKCYKVRLPASGGIQAMPAYDSYYKTCIK